MEPAKLLTSGLTLEESKARRQEKQAARYRHRLGTYVPSGDNRGLLEALMATSPRKSSTPRRHVIPEPTKGVKSIKRSMKGNGNDEIVNNPVQETEERTKLKKPASRKSINTTDPSEGTHQGERCNKDAPKRSGGRVRVGVAKGGVREGSKPSTSHQTDEATSIAIPKTTKSSKKPAAVATSKRSKPSSRETDAEADFGNQPHIPKRFNTKSKKSSVKPPPIQTDEESDDLAIKTMKTPWKGDKGKARTMASPRDTFESAGTDSDLADPRPGPSHAKLPSAKEKAVGDTHSDAREVTATPIIPRMASDRREASEEEEEEQQQQPPQKKRSYPHNVEGEEEPSLKRGRTRESDGGGQGERSARTKPKRQSKKPPPKPTGTKGRTRKKVEPLPETSDGERDEAVSSGPEAPRSDTRKRQRRKLGDMPTDEKPSEPSPDEASSNPSHVRLDSIPPEGIVIRKKNGIVERLLPPMPKPKRKALINKGKTRGSLRRAIPAHVLKYVGPTRFGSPLKAQGTDTDDDLNL